MSKVGDSISAPNASWTFSGDVADNFEDHVSKSVPFYHEGHDLIVKLSDFFVKSDSVCYEFGSSTGILSHKLATRNTAKSGRFIGIDSVPEMVAYARNKYQAPNLAFEIGDVLSFELEPSDFIVSYYVVQFVRPSQRQELFNRIFNNLKWGGAFICFEKVRAPDARFQDMMTALYTDYKLDQGYNAEEIVGKSRSLKGVLEPFSSAGNLDLFKRAGFVDVMSIFKYVCFEGFIAIK
jgi:tRNA (cmo5U34)-methyltransferase